MLLPAGWQKKTFDGYMKRQLRGCDKDVFRLVATAVNGLI